MVISPGKENETIKKLPPTRMREGKMWGCNLSQVNRWVDVEGKIDKIYNIFRIFIIYVI